MNGPTTDATHPSLAHVFRGDRIESFHRGVVAVVSGDRLVYGAGDVDRPQFLRSSAKPFQALTALAAFRAADFEASDRELTAMAASHGGTPLHEKIVRGLLARVDLPLAALKCGAHSPYDQQSAQALVREGRTPEPIHHNCSGKHAGMLVAARLRGLDVDGYLHPEHPLQRENRACLARYAGLDVDEVGVEVDGCGAPTFVLSARSVARAFGAFVSSKDPDAVRLRAAVAAEPLVYAGAKRTCTKLIQATRGAVYPKAGAEGFYAFGESGAGLGVAVKFDDGSHRATEPLLAALLLRFAPPADAEARDALKLLRGVPIKNAAGRVVGRIEPLLP